MEVSVDCLGDIRGVRVFLSDVLQAVSGEDCFSPGSSGLLDLKGSSGGRDGLTADLLQLLSGVVVEENHLLFAVLHRDNSHVLLGCCKILYGESVDMGVLSGRLLD